VAVYIDRPCMRPGFTVSAFLVSNLLV